ncbi:MAG: GxxExxY protein [bacterium]|nr:GxxExxY protein [bacterium]
MHEDLTYRINGGLFAVYNALGNIWNEEAYEQALELELQSRNLLVERQKEFEVFYFGKRVGQYRLDLLVEHEIIVELKAIPEVLPLHQAQLIAYLKGYEKALGILANFGGDSLYHRTFPNKLRQTTPLQDTFDFDRLQVPGKEHIRDLLYMANRVLIALGVGYFHQIYRRALYYELKTAGAEFEIIKEVTANYHNRAIAKKEVNFFRLGDLLLSVMAVQDLTPLRLLKFRHYITHLNCRRGLIFNFHTTRLDFRYFTVE